ncbi:CHASE domain-containing protein [Chloroflexus sp.]|uniref:CHASE domain-containing protein n=1 Tax=Chloroflexus sp. TaxID=1904827 RepID=UPI0026370FBE|nr:CHASE domain-containing protein [uncultured Chloroflexus sp.]
MTHFRRRALIGLGFIYAILIWAGAQPILVTRGLPLVWFAAGVAAGSALLFGRRVLPVIFGGALAGYSAVFWQLGVNDQRLLIIGLIFAVSATGQAWLIDLLVRRFGGLFPPTDVPGVLRVSGLLTLAVLPAPFVGAATMAIAGVQLAFVWPLAALQWWLNFVAGTLLLAPWIVFGFYYWQKRAVSDLWLWPISSLLLALLLLSLQLIWRDAEQRYTVALQIDAREVASLVNDRLIRYEQAIQSVRAFIAASQRVEQHEFTTFTRALFDQLPALQSVGWAPRVTRAERLAFERQIQETGIPDFAIREPGAYGPVAADRDEYYPLTYAEPFADRRPVLGMDMAVEPIRREALAQARDSGRTVMTQAIRPYTGNVVSPSVLLITPVYTSGPLPQSVSERRERIRGVVLLLVSPEELVAQALGPIQAPDLEIMLLDQTETPPRLLAFLAPAAPTLPVPPDPTAFLADSSARIELASYQRSWLLAMRPGATYPRFWFNWDVITRSVVAVASVVVFFIFYNERQRHEARQRRLTRTYMLLSAINQVIIRERDPARILQAACQIAVKEGEFRLAWAGVRQSYADGDYLEPVAIDGAGQDCAGALRARMTEDSSCPMVQTWLTRQSCIIDDVATDPRAVRWREWALRCGFRSLASFPLIVEGKVYATLGLYADQPDFFTSEELRLLDELAQDIAFGITVCRQEEQLRASEQRNHMIVSALPDIVFRLTRTGLIIDVESPAGVKLLSEPETFLNRPLEVALDEKLSRQVRAALDAAFTSGELQAFSYQLTIDGQERYFEARIKAIPVGDEAIAIVRDVTAWRVAELQLQAERDLLSRRVAERTAELSRANAELGRAARAKDEFLANMSHELRTPLNAILALSESMLEELRGPLNERQRAAIQTIETSGRHLLTLINDVLDLAKIEAGRMDIIKEVVALSDICEASMTLVREQARKKQIRLTLQLAEPQARFLADPRRLKQILVNLLSNAVKFTPAGGSVTLRVDTDVAQGTITFTVSDTGIGIAPDRLQQLFQPFVQLDSGLSRHHEGTGLGLALVRRLVDLHGGSVAVVSEVNKGSVFTVTLPYQAITSGLVVSPMESQLPPLRLALVIAASATTADQLARYLEEQQTQPVICSSGQSAVAQVAALHPDLVILELQLPDRSGWEIMADLRHDPELQHIPVILVAETDEVERGLSTGAVACLVKPIDRMEVQQALRQITTARPSATGDIHLGARVLLAEDNELNLMTMSEYLQARGYEVRVARNGREAIQMAVEWIPNLIIMDIQMPEMDGLEAIRQLRAYEQFATTPIIAVTALAMPGDRERCLLAGATDYLAKPVRLRNLVERIERFLKQRQHAI